MKKQTLLLTLFTLILCSLAFAVDGPCSSANYDNCYEYSYEYADNGAEAYAKIETNNLDFKIINGEPQVGPQSILDYKCTGDRAYLYKSVSDISCSGSGCTGAVGNIETSGSINLFTIAPLKPVLVCWDRKDGSEGAWSWAYTYYYYDATIQQYCHDTQCNSECSGTTLRNGGFCDINTGLCEYRDTGCEWGCQDLSCQPEPLKPTLFNRFKLWFSDFWANLFNKAESLSVGSVQELSPRPRTVEGGGSQ